ncbi:SdpI family protein [Pontibacter virosus]|uniref:SdpI/YhfL family protein n=1 Tax=Pontibacter virosus TaxID=1765052 RepID=A0A2U1AVW5_9BACT|nr:SdpI family protein [Pontibacter virosus]PVY40533.1 SdpI/YhfL family protein [Pontibacter virosus]
MAWTNPLFLIPAIIGVVCIAMGIIMRKYPPKQINGLYGYRTSRSMLSQERWGFAQQFAAKEFLKSGVRLASIAVLGLVVNIGNGVGLAIGLVIGLAFVAIPWMLTEKALKERFGEVEA